MPPYPSPSHPIPRSPLVSNLLFVLNIIILLSVAGLLAVGLWDLYFHPLTQTSPAWFKFFLALALANIFRRLPL